MTGQHVYLDFNTLTRRGVQAFHVVILEGFGDTPVRYICASESVNAAAAAAAETPHHTDKDGDIEQQ